MHSGAVHYLEDWLERLCSTKSSNDAGNGVCACGGNLVHATLSACAPHTQLAVVSNNMLHNDIFLSIWQPRTEHVMTYCVDHHLAGSFSAVMDIIMLCEQGIAWGHRQGVGAGKAWEGRLPPWFMAAEISSVLRSLFQNITHDEDQISHANYGNHTHRSGVQCFHCESID